MTITIVCDILGEENNGTTIACMNLIRFLHAQGHTVRVVCADQDKAGNECFYVVPELNLYLLNPIVERNGVTLPRVDKALLEDAIRDCDVVHTTFVLQLSHTAVKIAKAYNKPITSSFHCQAENVTAHFLCKDLDAINRGVYRACYQMVYQYSDIIHYPTQFIRDTFESVVGPTNGRVISNGVNSMFTPGPAKRPEGLEDKFLIVSTGRLSSEKNQEILIEAIGRSAHREQIHLILAGEGPREEHYRHLAEKYGVDMEIAFFTRQDLLNLLRCADLYCHPAEVEIESIACLEAIACGLVPVIANSPKSAAKAFALDEKSLFKPYLKIRIPRTWPPRSTIGSSTRPNARTTAGSISRAARSLNSRAACGRWSRCSTMPLPCAAKRHEPQDRLLSRPAARRLCADERAHPAKADRRRLPL